MEELPQKHDIDYIVMSGDFNASDYDIVARFPGFTPAFRQQTHGMTTQHGMSIDNVASSDGLHFANQAVWHQAIFQHHPISTDAAAAAQ